MRLTHNIFLLGLAVGCSTTPPPKLPPRPAGCEVTVYRGGVPQGVTMRRLGEVVSSCGKNDADSDCIRSLQDEVCKLGGNLVYDVPDKPEPESDTMLRYTGVAATSDPEFIEGTPP